MPALTRDQFEEKLAQIIERLKQALSPVAIYLFGSYAYGNPSPDSDLDLLVVIEDSPLSVYQRDAIAYRALGDIPLSIDVMVYTEAEFEKLSAQSVSFERTVKQKGKLVHAA